MIKYALYKDCFWIRFCGYGFSICYNHEPLFSERAGCRKCFRIGKFKLEILR